MSSNTFKFPCLSPAGSSSGRPAESTEPTGTLGADEQNNGLRKKAKDNNVSAKQESTAPQSSQSVAANERTHPAVNEEAESGQSKGSETETQPVVGSKETREDDSTHVKEDDTNRTREAQEGANSSASRPESNNLDFDLSSDSDSDSVTGKPPSSESDAETPSKESGQEAATQERPCEDGAKEEDSKGGGEGESSSESAEPSGVLLPDPELGNGCSDRREPETESQNSEQSGVTMGEELLDQSMEDDDEEEEEEADNDQDDHLIYLEEVLERIHAEYYARYEAHLKKEASEMPDIRKIVPELKGRTLEGTTIVFSGLYPTNYPMERTREYYHAKALGAKLGKNLILSGQNPNRTTHLIAARAGTYTCLLISPECALYWHLVAKLHIAYTAY